MTYSKKSLHPTPTPRPKEDAKKHLPRFFDVLIVGSGAAGLYAALCLPSHYEIGLISKEKLNSSSSDWAQGGIAAPMALTDSPTLHGEDTIKAGQGICEPESVKFLVENATRCIESLVRMGVPFDRQDQELAMTLEAAHSRPRILHSQDTTGQAIIEVLTARVLERPNIYVYEQATALDLWLNPDTGHCQGVSLLYQTEISWLKAQAVILATGGCGQVFEKTTNPLVSTGDGAAIAWRAGAILRDLEFVQFHPTVLNKPGVPNFLISEAVRGEGGHLIDGQGKRFVFDYHASGELAPRDVVSRAIFSHATKHNESVYLDLRPIAPEKVRHRFPNIMEKCRKWGIDVLQEPIPVSPAVHYWMGGIAVNLDNSTSIPRLYALGEVASTGIHGANRLASNSLLECLVFAQQFSDMVIEPNITEEEEKTLTISVQTDNWDKEIGIINQLRRDLPALMWQNAGISRQGNDLQAALEQVSGWREQFYSLEIGQFLLNLTPDKIIQLPVNEVTLREEQAEKQLKMATEMLNLLDVAFLILQSAGFRTESRGGHYRSDYPETNSAWQVHTLVQNKRFWQSPVTVSIP